MQKLQWHGEIDPRNETEMRCQFFFEVSVSWIFWTELCLADLCWPLLKTSLQLPSLKLTAKAPENGSLEDDFPFGKPYFQGRTVSFRECILLLFQQPRTWEPIAKTTVEIVGQVNTHQHSSGWRVDWHVVLGYLCETNRNTAWGLLDGTWNLEHGYGTWMECWGVISFQGPGKECKKSANVWICVRTTLGRNKRKQWLSKMVVNNPQTKRTPTLPETNSSHLPGSHTERKLIFQPSIFRG